MSQDEAVRPPFRQLSLDAAEDVDTVVANVDTERMLWLLYRVNVLNVLIEVFVLATEFRLLLGAGEVEMLVGDAAGRHCCCSALLCPAVSATEEGDSGGSGDFVCDEIGGGSSPMITSDTFAVRPEPEFESERESDRELRAASPELFPNESFHLLGFFVIVGMDVAAGTGGGGGGNGGSGSGGTSGNDWREAEAERVCRLSSRASVWDADASNSEVWM